MKILRPLSPHLPIYKPQLTSTFPISHRISGAFLATMVLFFYLLYLKMGLICFTYHPFYQFFFYSSKFILIGATLTALARSSYRLYTGIRRLIKSFFDLTFSFKDLFPSLLLTFLIAIKMAPGYEISFCMEGNVNAPDLELRLGPPEVEVADPEGLSPAERELRERLNRDGRDNLSLDDVQAMAGMKEDIVTRISQLDPHPFWTEQRARIISSYIVTPTGEEYSRATLEKIWRELGNRQDHSFLKRMRKLRKDYELLGRFY